MKNRYSLRFTTLTLLLGLSMGVPASELQNQVDAALSTYVKNLDSGSVDKRNEGSWQKLDTRLTLPVCGQALAIEPFSGKSTGRTTLRIICTAPEWSLLVPVNIRTFQQVVVSKAPVARRGLVGANVLALEEREIKPTSGDYFQDPALVRGRLAKRPISADQIITANMLESPDVINKGQTVILEAASGSFAIRTAGEALTNGALGDTIRVRNTQSGRVVEGTIVSEGKVRVAL